MKLILLLACALLLAACASGADIADDSAPADSAAIDILDDDPPAPRGKANGQRAP